MSRHIHLDLLGGISGDMFIGAMLDAFPEQAGGLNQVVEQAGFPDLVCLDSREHTDGVLSGTRFTVRPASEEHHHHRHYSEIRDKLGGSALSPGTKEIALDIFAQLADAEAKVHSKPVDEVAFHEVGAWDSIADVVLSAHLIEHAGASSWSVSPIPAGRGFVDTAHGSLPLPAPATSLLLAGFELFDDGVEGERVTPTGAAILSHLAPVAAGRLGKLAAEGYGFGTKRFEGFSNVLRAMVYERSQSDAEVFWKSDEVARLSFDVDDATPEALAVALTQLREEAGVLDVTEQPYWGKKGRAGSTVTLLVKPEREDAVIARCFTLTPTLGIRREQVARAVLERSHHKVEVDGAHYTVKVAHRGGAYTAKAEMDELAAAGLTQVETEQLRQRVEQAALEEAMKERKP